MAEDLEDVVAQVTGTEQRLGMRAGQRAGTAVVAEYKEGGARIAQTAAVVSDNDLNPVFVPPALYNAVK